MPIDGVDYSGDHPDAGCLARSGFRFAVRYVSYSSWKNMTRAEVERLTGAGLSVVTVWQNGARDALAGYERGRAYAREAQRQHKALGGGDAPIYFAVDFDALYGQMDECRRYLQGAASVIGLDRVGVYGSFYVVEYMQARGIRWRWQTYAWSDGRLSSHAQLYQYHNGVSRCGGTVDLNHAYTSNYGQWDAAGGGATPPGGEDDMPAPREWNDADRDAIEDMIQVGVAKVLAAAADTMEKGEPSTKRGRNVRRDLWQLLRYPTVNSVGEYELPRSMVDGEGLALAVARLRRGVKRIQANQLDPQEVARAVVDGLPDGGLDQATVEAAFRAVLGSLDEEEEPS